MLHFGIEMAGNYIRLQRPSGYFDFIKLAKNPTCVLSDSGTVQEVCAIFNVLCVTLRDVTERPRGRRGWQQLSVRRGARANRILCRYCTEASIKLGSAAGTSDEECQRNCKADLDRLRSILEELEANMRRLV